MLPCFSLSLSLSVLLTSFSSCSSTLITSFLPSCPYLATYLLLLSSLPAWCSSSFRARARTSVRYDPHDHRTIQPRGREVLTGGARRHNETSRTPREQRRRTLAPLSSPPPSLHRAAFLPPRRPPLAVRPVTRPPSRESVHGESSADSEPHFSARRDRPECAIPPLGTVTSTRTRALCIVRAPPVLPSRPTDRSQTRVAACIHAYTVTHARRATSINMPEAWTERERTHAVVVAIATVTTCP